MGLDALVVGRFENKNLGGWERCCSQSTKTRNILKTMKASIVRKRAIKRIVPKWSNERRNKAQQQTSHTEEMNIQILLG